jgi:hypothetical protein
MPGLRLPQVALLLAVALAVGCHKNTPSTDNQAANPTSSAQPAQTSQSGAPSAAAPVASSSPGQPAPAAAAPAASAPESAPSPAPQQAANTPLPPPEAPPSPEVPAGTVLSIRMNQGIDVKHAQAGENFSGTIVNTINVDENTVIPAGSTVEGVVVRAHKRGHFKGASVLQLTLTGLNVNGKHYRLDTSTLTRAKKGKGKRTAAFIGGGSGLGMLIGGVATGGVGLLIGGLAGAGAGTAGAAFTGNKDVNIPAESVVSFRLAQPIQLR